MRILYCNKYSFPFSGTESYLFDVMQLMRDEGHEVALFSMADSRAPATEYDGYFVGHRDFKAAHGLLDHATLAAHAIYSREARRRIGELVRHFRPDVAHIRNIYHHLSPSILWELKAQRVPVIYHLNDFKLLCPTYNLVAHGNACEACHQGRFWHAVSNRCYSGGTARACVLAIEAYVHRWLRTYATCVDRFLAPSQFVKDKFVENGWDAARIDVLPHFQRLPAGDPVCPEPDAPILYFGRLSPEKGVADLIEAMRRLPNIRLQIAGDGPQRGHLEKLARGAANIEFLGHVASQRLNDLISRSRFTVFPSRAYETFGKAILESYAHAQPVIASDLGSRRELVEQGVTGFLFPPGDVNQLGTSISWLANAPQLAARMGAAGHKLIRDRYSPESHCRALTALYRDLQATPICCHSERSEKSAFDGKLQILGRFSARENRKLNIAFIGGRGVAAKYSGIESYYEEVGSRLASMGHSVTAYCRTYFTPNIPEYRGMKIVRLPTLRSKHFETFVHTLLSTIHVLFTDADIVHYNALGPSLFSFVPRLLGKRTVVTVQGLDWQRKKWGRFAAAVLRAGEFASARFPNETIAVSRTLQDYYHAQHGISPVYIPNGTIIRDRHHPTRLSQWGLDPRNYILFLGRFSPEKNCDLLIDAYERIDTPVKLVLAGGSSHTDGYAAKLRARQNHCVRLLDYVSGEALDELLTNAMLFILPSDLEGMSLALLDAMGAGLCVLASDIPENRELVEHVGFTFRAGDIDDLERMLRLLIGDNVARESAGRAAQERVRQHYLWPAIAERTEAVYRDMMGWSADHEPFSAPEKAPEIEHVA